ncbi:hypothetical protein AB4Z48_19480 [Cupriavidus sp. 2TAF22]|uniref:hypothetical protein n=1 Tax=unclassified Cupriavidus TaxID=2640874 RepID=UPI003F9004E1
MKSALVLLGAASALCMSLLAHAGPDWQVIEKARADQRARQNAAHSCATSAPQATAPAAGGARAS